MHTDERRRLSVEALVQELSTADWTTGNDVDLVADAIRKAHSRVQLASAQASENPLQ
jgi:hypothetical protein